MDWWLIILFIGGLVLVGPSVAEQTAVQNELASGDGVPTEGQRRRLARADRLMRLATRIDLPLILLAGLTMGRDEKHTRPRPRRHGRPPVILQRRIAELNR